MSLIRKVLHIPPKLPQIPDGADHSDFEFTTEDIASAKPVKFVPEDDDEEDAEDDDV